MQVRWFYRLPYLTYLTCLTYVTYVTHFPGEA